MAIIRGKVQATDNFTIMPNHWLRDPRLSLKAIGLLSQVMSHSEGWSMSIASLAKANNVGKDSIRTAINELETAGYLHRSQPRNQGTNRFEEAVWVTGEPLSGFPMTEKPMTGNPYTENPTPKNNNEEEQVKEEQVLETSPQIKFEVRESKKHWDDFMKFYNVYPRKTGKADAYKAFVKALKDASLDDILAGAFRFAHDKNLPVLKSKIKHPATWLNKGCWDDEPLPVPIYTREEMAEINAMKNSVSRKRSVEATKREIEESRAKAAVVALEAAPERCKHDRIMAACPHCFRNLQ